MYREKIKNDNKTTTTISISLENGGDLSVLLAKSSIQVQDKTENNKKNLILYQEIKKDNLKISLNIN
jgi:hypothetical protein